MYFNSNGIPSQRKLSTGYEPLEALIAPNRILRVVKLTALIIMIACLQVSARTNAQRLSISMKNTPLGRICSKIEQKTNYVFFYDLAILKEMKPVMIDAKDVAVEDPLRKVLKEQVLDFSILEQTIFIKTERLLNRMEIPATLNNSVSNILGVVRCENGGPLAGTTVYIRELKTVDLKQVQNSLDQTMVKEYYNTTKRLAIGNVTTVKGEDIQKQPATNPFTASEGRVPGLYIAQASGILESSLIVRLSGQNSLSIGNNALYIIDGITYSSTSSAGRIVPPGYSQ